MIKQAFPVIALIAMLSCKNQSTETTKTEESAPAATTATETVTDKPVMPELPYPVKRINWEIGNPNNIKTVLDLYKAWDNHNIGSVVDHFADTVYLRIPEDKHEISIPNNQIARALGNNRNTYKDAVNEILSATSLKCTDTGEEWVMVTTYNKWTEKNGKKASLLYHDDWLLVNGKVKFMLSFDKIPTNELIKANLPE